MTIQNRAQELDDKEKCRNWDRKNKRCTEKETWKEKEKTVLLLIKSNSRVTNISILLWFFNMVTEEDGIKKCFQCVNYDQAGNYYRQCPKNARVRNAYLGACNGTCFTRSYDYNASCKSEITHRQSETCKCCTCSPRTLSYRIVSLQVYM